LGAFLVVVVALLAALLAALMPFGGPGSRGGGYVNQPSIQAVAGNLVAYHTAAVAFVSIAANSGSSWTFTDADQRTVRCVASYASGAYGGTCPGNQFTIPSYLPAVNSTFAAGSLNSVNWRVHYNNTSRTVITYSVSTTNLAGYTASQVAGALGEYNLIGNSGWYWGLMSGSSPFTLSNGTVSLNLPASCAALGGGEACAAGLVGIATVIP
jgi:hypothetical protein